MKAGSPRFYTSSISVTLSPTPAAGDEKKSKGWTLPTTKQIDNNTVASVFNPVRGGYYNDASALIDKATAGRWWGGEAANSARRYMVSYNNDTALFIGLSSRGYSRYIRCVSEEKTVLDLTYMREMRSKIPQAP